MKATEDNPVGNALSPGITENEIAQAIQQSGYPLQSVIAAELSQKFYVQEEWSYVDRESGELRALDIYAELRRDPSRRAKKTRVRPHLAMLIECKRSELPFLFFRVATETATLEFPLIAGLKQDTVRIITNNDLTTFHIPVLTCLGLWHHQFAQSAPAYCTTFNTEKESPK